MLSMLKVVVVGFLSLVLLCMIPTMGGTPHHSGHLHHDDTASCATCMVSIDLSMLLLLLSLLGLAMLIVPVLPKLVPPHSPFHPPRFQS
jgi:hypothetical protein